MTRKKLLCLTIGVFIPSCAAPAKPRSTAALTQPEGKPAGSPTRAQQLELAIETKIVPKVQVHGEEQFSSLPALMEQLKVPAVSIAVFEKNQLVWAKAYGVRQAGQKEGVDPQTRFQAASISKPVNALTVLRVAKAKGLDIDKPVNTYLKSWTVPAHRWSSSHPVTLRHLLSHTAGTTVHGFAGYPTGTPIPSTVQVLSGQSPSNSPAVLVDKEPGASFRYSGGGTVISQLLLEDQLGLSYPQIAAQYTLEPLQMRHSSFEQPLRGPALVKSAVGHSANGAVIPGKRQVHPELAAAGLWTTPSDLVQFLISISKARRGQPSPVSPDTAKRMTDTALALGDRGMAIGLGPFLRSFNGHPAFGHGGSNLGFRCEMIASLEGDFGYAIMTNSDNGDALIQAISRTLLSQPGWPGGYEALKRVPMPEALPTTLQGTYSTGGLDVFSIEFSSKRLKVQRPFQAPQELVHLGKDRLVNRETRIFFQLSRADNGQALLLDKDGEPTQNAKRLAAPSPLWELYQGREKQAIFAFEKLATTAKPEQLEAQLNRFGYQLASRQELDAALTVLTFVTKVRPKSSNAFDSLAEIHALRGENSKAIEHYEASLRLLEEDPSADKSQIEATKNRVQATIERLRRP